MLRANATIKTLSLELIFSSFQLEMLQTKQSIVVQLLSNLIKSVKFVSSSQQLVVCGNV